MNYEKRQIHPSSFILQFMRRPERLAETLREEIIEIVGFELEDPRIMGVTVTDVVVSDNKRDANIFVLIEGGEEQINEALSALQHATTYIRRQITYNLNLHHAPQLHFIRDTVEEKASRIEEILQDLDIKEESP